MSFLMFNFGEQYFAECGHNKRVPEDMDLICYQNNHALADGDTRDDYTESTFSGYQRIELNAALWTVTPNAPTESEYPEQTFASDMEQAPELCYGYLLVLRNSDEDAICGWRFDDGPYSISKDGDAIDITPNILWKKPSEV